MNTITTAQTTPTINRPKSLPEYLWLIIGAVLIFLSTMRWSIPLAAWFMPVPLLIFISRTTGWRARIALLFTLLIATHIALAKIITPPLSYAFVPLFALPTAFGMFIILLLWNAIRQRAGEHWAIYSYAFIITVSEWLGYNYSEMGSFSSIAITQVNNIQLLQIVSVFGITAISFMLSWFAGITAMIVLHGKIKPFRWHVIAFACMLLLIYIYGAVRVQTTQNGTQVRAAAVATELILSGTFPDQATLDKNNTQLFARSKIAADSGAQIIVWNEGATVVEKSAEKAFVNQATQFANENQVHLVLAYVVPITLSPLEMENKYLWIRSDGTIAEEYFKHHPVPGEGSIKGTDPLRVIDTEFGTMAGAICYDYDFPAMSREHARLGAGLIAVPSSDWKGIDPMHTQMIRLRAIESGISIIRSVRAAASAAYDGYGRLRGWMDYYEDNTKILVVNLPTQQVFTVYNKIGDVLPYLSLILLAIIVVKKPKKPK